MGKVDEAAGWDGVPEEAHQLPHSGYRNLVMGVKIRAGTSVAARTHTVGLRRIPVGQVYNGLAVQSDGSFVKPNP